MRYSFILVLLFINIGAFALKPDTAALSRAVTGLNHALVNRDTVRLKWILRDDVRYYHSNGWLETKADVIEDLYNGKLIYKRIKPEAKTVRVAGEIAQVSTNTDVEVDWNGKPLQLRLKVVQVWVWKNNHWGLFSRHSEKI